MDMSDSEACVVGHEFEFLCVEHGVGEHPERNELCVIVLVGLASCVESGIEVGGIGPVVLPVIDIHQSPVVYDVDIPCLIASIRT